MSVRPILRIGHPLLAKVSQPVPADGTPGSVGSPELNELIADMLATMQHVNGAGLAAVQIGVPVRVMIFGITKNPRYPDAEPVPTTVLVNPSVTVVDDTMCEYFEGCLSVPGLRGPVLRPRTVRYDGVDAAGQRIVREVSGFHARVFQHEYDHLDGRLFPSRITDFSRFGFTEELEKGGVIPAVVAPPLLRPSKV
jgi:peptide deformylase